MPIKTMEAYLDHGHPEETLSRGLDEARRDVAALADFGIDYSDITDNFSETDGVRKFEDSYRQLLDGLEAKRRQSAGVAARP